MAAPPLNALAAFLGEAPSAAALHRAAPAEAIVVASNGPPGGGYGAGQGAARRPAQGARTRAASVDSSDGEGDAEPYDGGFDDARDYDAQAPYSAPAPRRIREFDEPKGFDCRQSSQPVSEIAAERTLCSKALGSGRVGGAKARPLPPRGPPDAGTPPGAAALSTKSRAPKPARAASLGGTMTPEPGAFASFIGGEGSPSDRAPRGGLGPRAAAAAEIDLAGEARRAPAAAKVRGGSRGPQGNGYVESTAHERSTTPKGSKIALDPLGTSARRRFGGRA